MVIETTLATGPTASTPPPTLVRQLIPRSVVRGGIWLLRRALPIANPDFEEAYERVRNWWIEIDAAGVPQREPGFDALGETIVAGPIGQNMGFWTDSHMAFSAAEYKSVSDAEFDSVWSAFEASHPAMTDKDG
jgi:hypothetical protein